MAKHRKPENVTAIITREEARAMESRPSERLTVDVSNLFQPRKLTCTCGQPSLHGFVHSDTRQCWSPADALAALHDFAYLRISSLAAGELAAMQNRAMEIYERAQR